MIKNAMRDKQLAENVDLRLQISSIRKRDSELRPASPMDVLSEQIVASAL